MSGYVTLLGAEDVRSAGATIAQAAESMRHAGSNIDDSMRCAMDRFEELVSRFEAAVDRFIAEAPHGR